MIHPLGINITGRVRFSGPVSSPAGAAYIDGSTSPSATVVNVTADGDEVEYDFVTSALSINNRVRIKITVMVNGVSESRWAITREMGLSSNAVAAFNAQQSHPIMGTATAGSTTSLTLGSTYAHSLVGWWVYLISGTGAGQGVRQITSHTAGTAAVSFVSGFTTPPATGTGYVIVPQGQVDLQTVRQATINALTSGLIQGNVTQIAGGNTAATLLAAQLNLGRANTAQGGTSTTITLDAGASSVNNAYRDHWIICNGQLNAITAYVGSTKVATVVYAWTTTPANGNSYQVAPIPAVDLHTIKRQAVTATAGINADQIANLDAAVSSRHEAGASVSSVTNPVSVVDNTIPTPPTSFTGGGASLPLGGLTPLNTVSYGTGVTRQAFAGGKASGVSIPAGNTWSLTVWLKPTSTALKVAFGNTGTGTFWGGISNGKFAFSLGTIGVQESAAAATLNAWSQLRLVCDGSGVRWYVNGTLAGSSDTTATAAGLSDTTLCVGGLDANDNYNWTDLIDELAVWSTALTSAPSTVLGNEAGLLRAYNFDGNLSDAVASLAVDTPIVTALSSTSVTLKAYAKGVGPLTYQWHRSATPGFVASGGTAIAGATSDTLTDSPAGATRWYYDYVVTDANGQMLTSFERPVLLGVTTALPTPTVVDLPTPRIDIVNIGDSTEADAAWNDNVSPIKRAVGLLTALTPCVATYRNYAVSGTSATQWAQAGVGTYLDSLIASEGGSLTGKTIHLRLGMNDAQMGVIAAGYAAAMAAIVARIKAVGGKVILSYPTFREAGSHWPTHPSDGFDQSTTPLLLAYQVVIDAMVDGVDVFAGDRTSYDIFAAHAPSVLFDRIHNNALGAVIMARSIAAAVIRSVTQSVQISASSLSAVAESNRVVMERVGGPLKIAASDAQLAALAVSSFNYGMGIE